MRRDGRIWGRGDSRTHAPPPLAPLSRARTMFRLPCAKYPPAPSVHYLETLQKT